MTTAARAEPTCPKCQGQMWDNRLDKRSPKAPDFKCKNRACDGVIWPEKTNRAVRAPSPPATPIRQAVDVPNLDQSLDSLFATYDVCYAHALTVARRSKEKHDLGFTAEGVAAIAATLLIAAQKKGIV